MCTDWRLLLTQLVSDLSLSERHDGGWSSQSRRPAWPRLAWAGPYQLAGRPEESRQLRYQEDCQAAVAGRLAPQGRHLHRPHHPGGGRHGDQHCQALSEGCEARKEGSAPGGRPGRDWRTKFIYVISKINRSDVWPNLTEKIFSQFSEIIYHTRND